MISLKFTVFAQGREMGYKYLEPLLIVKGLLSPP